MPKRQVEENQGQPEWQREMGRRIRGAREKTGLQQYELADALGIAPATLSGWELGKYPPSVPNLRRLAEITREDSGYLIPQPLPRKDSISRLSHEVGGRLGRARLRKLVEMPENRLRKEIDAVLGQYLIEDKERPRKKGS